ncbi:hypothetical protein K1719_041619 [Acacia pycnantha]|nr:hypothetical protein K1719_041619 [Acacia pycnantha]
MFELKIDRERPNSENKLDRRRLTISSTFHSFSTLSSALRSNDIALIFIVSTSFPLHLLLNFLSSVQWPLSSPPSPYFIHHCPSALILPITINFVAS